MPDETKTVIETTRLEPVLLDIRGMDLRQIGALAMIHVILEAELPPLQQRLRKLERSGHCPRRGEDASNGEAPCPLLGRECRFHSHLSTKEWCERCKTVLDLSRKATELALRKSAAHTVLHWRATVDEEAPEPWLYATFNTRCKRCSSQLRALWVTPHRYLEEIEDLLSSTKVTS